MLSPSGQSERDDKCVKGLVGIVKGPLGIPSRRWKNDDKINLEETGCSVNWIGLLWLWIEDKWPAFVNAILNISQPYDVKKFLNI